MTNQPRIGPWHTAALLTVPALSLLLLAAHFYRAGLLPGVIGALGLVVLLGLRRPWVLRLMQLVLVLGAAEWMRTLWVIAELRISLQQPVLRLAIILGFVAAFTLLAALLFETSPLGRYYGRGAIRQRPTP